MGSSRRGALAALLPLLAGFFPARASAAADPIECPKGTHRTMTDNPYDPFRCATPAQEREADAKKQFGGFKEEPKCPQGTRPVATPGGLQAYRCVSARPRSGEPEVPALHAGPAPSPLQSYRRYAVESELAVDIPKTWHVTDGWRDEVPTLYLELATGKEGRQVTMVVSKIAVGQPDFMNMGAAIKKEKEWQKAKDGGRGKVGGLPARFTYVPKESRTAYVKRDAGTYYTIAYSAPASSYDVYKPAYDRLLKSFRPAGARSESEDLWSSKNR